MRLRAVFGASWYSRATMFTFVVQNGPFRAKNNVHLRHLSTHFFRWFTRGVDSREVNPRVGCGASPRSAQRAPTNHQRSPRLTTQLSRRRFCCGFGRRTPCLAPGLWGMWGCFTPYPASSRACHVTPRMHSIDEIDNVANPRIRWEIRRSGDSARVNSVTSKKCATNAST